MHQIIKHLALFVFFMLYGNKLYKSFTEKSCSGGIKYILVMQLYSNTFLFFIFRLNKCILKKHKYKNMRHIAFVIFVFSKLTKMVHKA